MWKIWVVWLCLLASAKGGQHRSARQWIYPVLPKHTIHGDNNMHGLAQYPNFASAIDLHRQIANYNQYQQYPNNEVIVAIFPSKTPYENPDKVLSLELNSKLKAAQHLRNLFGHEFGKTSIESKPQPKAVTAKSLDDINTVSVLPQHLRKILNQLKEEKQRREYSSERSMQHSRERSEGIMDAIKSYLNLNKIVGNARFSKQLMRSEDISLEDDVSDEEDDQMNSKLKKLTNDEINELIIFYNRIIQIYDQASSAESVIKFADEHITNVEQDKNNLSLEIYSNKNSSGSNLKLKVPESSIHTNISTIDEIKTNSFNKTTMDSMVTINERLKSNLSKPTRLPYNVGFTPPSTSSVDRNEYYSSPNNNLAIERTTISLPVLEQFNNVGEKTVKPATGFDSVPMPYIKTILNSNGVSEDTINSSRLLNIPKKIREMVATDKQLNNSIASSTAAEVERSTYSLTADLGITDATNTENFTTPGTTIMYDSKTYAADEDIHIMSKSIQEVTDPSATEETKLQANDFDRGIQHSYLDEKYSTTILESTTSNYLSYIDAEAENAKRKGFIANRVVTTSSPFKGNVAQVDPGRASSMDVETIVSRMHELRGIIN